MDGPTPLAQLTRGRLNGGESTTYYVLSDPQGNVVGLATADGTLVAQYDYDPYGRLIRETGPKATSCPFRYSTKYRDPDLDLYYYGHRWYDAAAPKWLTPDPIGERGGANLTAFCSADPINHVDPLGLEEFGLIGLVPRTFDATDVLKQYLPGLDHTIGFRIDPQANAGRGALYVFLPTAYLGPGILREEAARGDTKFHREATEEEYAWFFLALWEQNVRENPRLSADLQAVVGLGYQADPRVFAADLGRIWRAYHRGETSKLIVKTPGSGWCSAPCLPELGVRHAPRVRPHGGCPIVFSRTSPVKPRETPVVGLWYWENSTRMARAI